MNDIKYFIKYFCNIVFLLLTMTYSYSQEVVGLKDPYFTPLFLEQGLYRESDINKKDFKMQNTTFDYFDGSKWISSIGCAYDNGYGNFILPPKYKGSLIFHFSGFEQFLSIKLSKKLELDDTIKFTILYRGNDIKKNALRMSLEYSLYDYKPGFSSTFYFNIYTSKRKDIFYMLLAVNQNVTLYTDKINNFIKPFPERYTNIYYGILDNDTILASDSCWFIVNINYVVKDKKQIGNDWLFIQPKTNFGFLDIYIPPNELDDYREYFFDCQANIKEESTRIDEISEFNKIFPLDKEFILSNLLFKKQDTIPIEVNFSQLDSLCLYLKDTKRRLEIHGYTDDSGEREFNDKLSLSRARWVKSYLESCGVPSLKIVVIGHGEEKPLYPNTTEENRKRNRRVEIVIIENDE